MAEPYIPMFARKSIVGATQETTSGTYVAPTAQLTSTTIYDATMVPEGLFEAGARARIGQFLGTQKSYPGAQIGRLRFRQDLRPGDFFDDMLTGAGFSLAGAIYSPESDMTNRKTWSFGLWNVAAGTTAVYRSLSGAVGNAVIRMRSGLTPQVEWDWVGAWRAVVDVASLPTTAIVTALPYRCASMTWTIGGAVGPFTGDVVIDLGAQLEMRADITSSAGVIHGIVVDRAPTIRVATEGRTIAQWDHWGALLAGTEVALQLKLVSGSKSITIDAPAAQRVEVGDESDANIWRNPLVFQCNPSSGDDELTFTIDET